MNRNSLEKLKIDYCRYDYFIANENGVRVRDIDPKYYNCKEVGKIVCYAEEDEYEDDRDINKAYDISFRFYEFSYNFFTPEYTYAESLVEDSWGDYREPIPENESYDENDWKVKVVENGGKEIVLKAIVNDNGDLITDGLEEVLKFIPEFQMFIVKFKIFKGSQHEKKFVESFGNGKYLWAVINLNGDLLFKPESVEIQFLSDSKMFEVGKALYYDTNGERIMIDNNF